MRLPSQRDRFLKLLVEQKISEQANVSKVLITVTEGACEVGTTYYSDTYGLEDKLDILQVISYDLTGNVIYPIAQVKNDEADDVRTESSPGFCKLRKI